MLFVEQPVVSLSLYNRANQWLLEPGWDGSTTFNRSRLKMYVRNRWSPIHISHGFAFKLHIWHKSENPFHWEIAYRRCHKPDSLQFMKSWENYATSFDAGLSNCGIVHFDIRLKSGWIRTRLSNAAYPSTNCYSRLLKLSTVSLITTFKSLTYIYCENICV